MVPELRSVEKAVLSVYDCFSQPEQTAGLINQNFTLLPISAIRCFYSDAMLYFPWRRSDGDMTAL